MIKNSELIKTIMEYRRKLPIVAFPMNLRIDLKDNAQALEYLVNLSSQAKGEQVPVNDYYELQKLMQAQNLLNNLISLPDFGTSGGAKGKIAKWQREKFHLSESDPVQIVTAAEVFELQKQWSENERYLRLPDEYIYEAQKSVEPYLASIGKMSKEEQRQRWAMINTLRLMKNPQELFDRAKISANNGLTAFIELIRSKHLDKDIYIDHVFIDLVHDLPKDTYDIFNSFRNISIWLTYGVDDRFRISKESIEKTLQQIQAANETRRRKEKLLKQEQDKKDQEQADKNLKQAPELMEQLQENDPEILERVQKDAKFRELFREALTDYDLSIKDHEYFRNLLNETQDLPIPTDLEQDEQLEKLGMNHKQEQLEDLKKIRALLNNMQQ